MLRRVNNDRTNKCTKRIRTNKFERYGEEIKNVESENLLAFTEELTYSTTSVGSGVISQRGLFSTYLKNNTNSVQDVAIITDGNPLVIEAPCCVDPDAIVAWTGRKPEFSEPGQLVIIQPSERLSGLEISVD